MATRAIAPLFEQTDLKLFGRAKDLRVWKDHLAGMAAHP
jgi:hypothetical protein